MGREEGRREERVSPYETAKGEEARSENLVVIRRKVEEE